MKKIFLCFVAIGLFGCSSDDNKTDKTVKLLPITDVDNNVYDVVKVGDQKWLKQNLNVSHYRNGDLIPEVKSGEEWGNLTIGAWCYYAYNSENGVIYGKLYNWYAVMDPRGLAPEGSHIPTNAEWTQLTNYSGGENNAGGPLKSVSQWNSPNTGATNKSGFTALPGGGLMPGGFGYIKTYGVWWTSTEDPQQDALALYRVMYSNSTKSEGYHNDKRMGLSVRCIKD